MPALPSVPSVLKAQFQHTYGGVPAWTHMYFRYSGNAPAVADAAAIANSLKSAWTTNFAPQACTACSLVLVQVTDLSSPTGAQNVSGGAAVAGTLGAALTANDCVLVNGHIVRRYRGGKPRQYWPLGAVSAVANPQQWSTTFVNNVQAAYNAIQTAALAITWAGGNIASQVSVGYYHGFTVVTNPTTGRAKNVPKPLPTPNVDTIASSTVNSRIATQRRRQHFSA